MIHKGDVYFTRKYNDPTAVRARPVVVISGNVHNRDSDSVIVAYVHAGRIPAGAPSVPIGCLRQNSCVLLDRVATLTKDRLTRKAGTVTKEELIGIESALCRVLEL